MRFQLFVFLLFVCSLIAAQVNTEKYRTNESVSGLGGYFEISGTIKSGNAEKTEGNLEGRLDWRAGSNTTFFIFDSEHEWVDGKRLSNEGLFHIRNVTVLNKEFKLEVYGQINYDKKILVDNRELAGAGFRFKIFDIEQNDISLGTSYMFEHENYKLPKNSIHPKEVNVSRWSSYIAMHFKLEENITFTSVAYYQPMFTEFVDYRLLNESSINISLSKLLSLNFNYRIRFDSKPPDGVKNTDTNTNFGIGIKF